MITDYQKFFYSYLNASAGLSRNINSMLQSILESFEGDRVQQAMRFFILLHGIIHYDIYHIGQIQLIKKFG
jgi:hypothetical protein